MFYFSLISKWGHLSSNTVRVEFLLKNQCFALFTSKNEHLKREKGALPKNRKIANGRAEGREKYGQEIKKGSVDWHEIGLLFVQIPTSSVSPLHREMEYDFFSHSSFLPSPSHFSRSAWLDAENLDLRSEKSHYRSRMEKSDFSLHLGVVVFLNPTFLALFWSSSFVNVLLFSLPLPGTLFPS